MSGVNTTIRGISRLYGGLASQLKHPVYPEFAFRIQDEIKAYQQANNPASTSLVTDTQIEEENFTSFLSDSPQIGLDSRLKVVPVSEQSSFISTSKIPKHISLLHSLANIEYSAVLGYTSILLMHSPLLLHHQDINTNNTMNNCDRYGLFVKDITSIVCDECRHFTALVQCLEKLGVPFGSLPVNSHIRTDLDKTVGNQLARLVLVSLLHEGRGLDGGGRVLAKVPKGEERDLLEMIIREEEGHVGLGIKWVREMVGGEEHIPQLLKDVSEMTGVKNSPQRMDFDRRARAGFRREWVDYPGA